MSSSYKSDVTHGTLAVMAGNEVIASGSYLGISEGEVRWQKPEGGISEGWWVKEPDVLLHTKRGSIKPSWQKKSAANLWRW